MKYVALFLNACAIGLLAWGLTGVVALLGRNAPQMRATPMEVKPLADKELQEQADIMAALTAIQGLSAQRAAVVGRAGGVPLVAVPAPGTPGSAGPLMPTRQLSLLLDAGDTQYAVIDEQLVLLGQSVQGGGRVKQIRDGTVQVSEKNGRQTLAMPLDSLRVGTLRAPHAQAPTAAVQEAQLVPSGIVNSRSVQ